MSVMKEVLTVIDEDISSILEDVNWNVKADPDDVVFLVEVQGALITVRNRIRKKLPQKEANNGEY